MKRLLNILTLSILTTSCATLFNQPHTSVTVHTTTEPSTIIHRYDTVNTVNYMAHFGVERKKDPLPLVVITDSLTKSVEIQAKNSGMYNANILLFPYYIFPSVLGFVIDWRNPKRYTYPRHVYINSADTISRYYRYYARADYKGRWNLHLSIPAVNYFLMMPENENAMTHTRYWGLTVGIDYYHSKDQFVNLGISRIANISILKPMHSDEKRITSKYVSISNNHRLGRQFTVGYGLSYARNSRNFNPLSYRVDYIDNLPLPGERKRGWKGHNAFGFIFPAYIQTGEYFNIGLIYRPTFYRPKLSNKFANEHLISLDLAWKIRLNR